VEERRGSTDPLGNWKQRVSPAATSTGCYVLAPDIVEAILEGRQPKAMQLEEVTRAMPSEWEAQRVSIRTL
jgi:hypothetical protein